jgi:hypothetical protein
MIQLFDFSDLSLWHLLSQIPAANRLISFVTVPNYKNKKGFEILKALKNCMIIIIQFL